MARLKIKNFSCIDEADIEICNLTIFIGPQASGKSVVAKLIYFFQEIIRKYCYVFELGDLKKVASKIESEFEKNFYQSAWGNKSFTIQFSELEFEIVLKRDYRSKKIKVILPEIYNNLINEIKELKSKNKAFENVELLELIDNTEISKIKKDFDKNLNALTKKKKIERQIFVPASRSYFTNMSKVISYFEKSLDIDPIVTSFGNVYSFCNMVLSRDRLFVTRDEKEHEIVELRKKMIPNLIKGKIERNTKFESNIFIEMEGNRKIPISLASSGQQELYPLLVVLETMNTQNNFKPIDADMLFIEEPEAHLFPEAQANLLKLIITYINEEKNKRDIIITTHSPYILAQASNLLKAGKISTTKKPITKTEEALRKILPEAFWLKPGSTSAYCFEDGIAKNILSEEESLIDSKYIDDCSEMIEKEFDSLLDIEFSNVKG